MADDFPTAEEYRKLNQQNWEKKKNEYEKDVRNDLKKYFHGKDGLNEKFQVCNYDIFWLKKNGEENLNNICQDLIRKKFKVSTKPYENGGSKYCIVVEFQPQKCTECHQDL